MKKLGVLFNSILLSSLVLGLASFRLLKAETTSTSNTDLINLLNEYYNNGVYTRKNSIKFNDLTLEESIENSELLLRRTHICTCISCHGTQRSTKKCF